LYEKHAYEPHHIWNCDEFDAQAKNDGSSFVIEKKKSRNVNKVVPYERKWLSILVCINAKGEKLSNSTSPKVKNKNLITCIKLEIKMPLCLCRLQLG